MHNINYYLTRDYFYSTCAGAVLGWSLLIFIIMTYLFDMDKVNNGWAIIYGIVSLIVVIGAIYRLCTKTNVSAVNQEIKKTKATIISEAIDELGIDPDECKVIKPVTLEYKVYEPSFFNSYIYKEEDDMPSNRKILVLCFSENQIFYYDYTFSLISNENVKNTGEFFYRDIVGFNIQSKKEIFTYRNQNYTRNYQIFTLKTTGGDDFSIGINKEDENKIQGMRQLLREKKKAMI